MPHEEEVLTGVDGRLGRITLNRPRALNALTHGMVRVIDAALAEWEGDPSVEAVVLTGAGERGLCAGGDIRAIYEDARVRGGASGPFWRDEYRLNARIARYPKPYLAVMDGIAMGGGVGLSAHGSLRVVTERSRVAMPETGIGFFPDVGSTFLLSRAPGELGTHLALTGAAIGAADALLCGLADHFVPSAELPALLRDELTEMPVREAPPGELAAAREWIDTCYAADSVEEIVERLRAEGSRGAKEAAETLAGRSPTSLKVTLAALRRARELDTVEEVLEQDHRLGCALLDSPDLVEGIRAQIVDKDRNPRWNPASLDGVSDADVERFFAPRGDGGIGLVPEDRSS
ncbi:enoyl-CoA hydratase/isomerase family protein [Streptomyces sp. NPDC048172]|uniref:enoyl-CoA hydratase/isomerase family protein n=1 Tax=Streptomyces sp. NPDC048172 TaxID=3365505 RepID=UPI00371BFB29